MGSGKYLHCITKSLFILQTSSYLHAIDPILPNKGHPFDGEYSPPVDTCQLGSCPEGLPLNASSTLMSYCGHFCGGMSNTAFTYGGVWNQISPREDLNSWLQNPALVESPISTDAQRISHSIWMKLKEKDECIRKRNPFATLSTIFLVGEEDNETSVAASPSSNAVSPSQTPSKSLFPTASSMPSSAPTLTTAPSSVPTLPGQGGGLPHPVRESVPWLLR